jgi:soluble lytic murein transglycosylase-like protein
MGSSAAHAFEHVTLRNGFSLDCIRHEAIGDRIRLYTGDTNYQELASAEIASIETMPDPPKPPPAPATVSQMHAIPTAAEMHDLLARAGAAHDIDVELLASVIKAESNFRVDAVSRAGARGLMQLMPSTAHDLGVQDVTRADQNIAGGTAYLDSLLKLYKDNLALALAAYNAGPAAVAKYHGIPPYRETRAYVSRVMNEFYRRKIALANTTNVASR